MTLIWDLNPAAQSMQVFDRRHVQGATTTNTSAADPNDPYPFAVQGPTRHSFLGTDQGMALRLSMPSASGSTSRYQLDLGSGGGSDPHLSLGASTLVERWVAFRCRLTGASWPATTNRGLGFFSVGFTSHFTNTSDNGPYGDLDTDYGIGSVANRHWGSSVNSTGNVEPPPSPSVGTINAGPIAQGSWVTFVVHTGWSRSSSGFREIWRDDAYMGRYDGLTSWSAVGASTMEIDFRWGCYWGGAFTSPYVLDVSWLKVGTTRADVYPGPGPDSPATIDVATIDTSVAWGPPFTTPSGLVA